MIKKTFAILLFAGLISFICLRFYADNIKSFPSYIHAWSQADRYALALNFQQNGFDLFHPQTYNLDPQFPSAIPLKEAKGITQVDFPIHDYLAGIIMQVIGNNSPVVFRVYVLLYGIMGMLFLYLMVLQNTRAMVKSVMVLLFGILSPVMIYYMDGFIPSITSVANVFIAYYFYFGYVRTRHFSQLMLAVLFGLLAALSRSPFVLFIGAMFLQEIMTFIKNKKLSFKVVWVFVIAFGILAGYFIYNRWLAYVYGSVFLTSLNPVHDISEGIAILKHIYHNWFTSYFTVFHYVILGIAVIVFIVQRLRRKKLTEFQKNLLPQVLITFTGAILFFIAMLRQFHSHDYYFLDSFYIPIILSFIMFLDGIHIKTSLQSVLAWIFVMLFGYMSYGKCRQDKEKRYLDDLNNHSLSEVKNFMGSANYLDSLGIKKDAKMLVIDAYSANIPFILMERKGYVVMGTSEGNVNKQPATSYNYVVIQNENLFSEVINYYPDIINELEPIGSNGKISIYKKHRRTKNLKEFLQIKSKLVFCTTSCSQSADSCDMLLFENVSCDSVLVIDPGNEFRDVVDIDLGAYESSPMNLLFSADCKLHEFEHDNTDLVISINNGSELVYYKSYAINKYLDNEVLSHYKKLYFMYPLPANEHRKLALKLYVWNNGRNALELKNISIGLYE